MTQQLFNLLNSPYAQFWFGAAVIVLLIASVFLLLLLAELAAIRDELRAILEQLQKPIKVKP